MHRPLTLTFCLLFLPMVSSVAEDSVCRHQPLVVKSRPVIERLPLKVIRPVDVRVTNFGALVVAEQKAGIVFLMTEDGHASIVGRELLGLQRVAESSLSGLHALCVRSASSTIYRLTDTGFANEWKELNFEAVGLAADGAGRVWTSDGSGRTVKMIDPTGREINVVQLSRPIVDIAADDQGAYVLLNSGRVISVATDGSAVAIGFVDRGCDRITIRPDGQVVALKAVSGELSELQIPEKQVPRGRKIATVPVGTKAIAFDQLGNLVIANPDLRAVTKVTSHFRISCPHCGQPLPMTLDPAAAAPKTHLRSF